MSNTTYELLSKTYPSLMNLEQVAFETGLAEGTLRNWIVTGRFPIPIVKIGGAVRVRTQDLASLIDENIPMPSPKKRRGRPRKADLMKNQSTSRA